MLTYQTTKGCFEYNTFIFDHPYRILYGNRLGRRLYSTQDLNDRNGESPTESTPTGISRIRNTPEPAGRNRSRLVRGTRYVLRVESCALQAGGTAGTSIVSRPEEF